MTSLAQDTAEPGSAERTVGANGLSAFFAPPGARGAIALLGLERPWPDARARDPHFPAARQLTRLTHLARAAEKAGDRTRPTAPYWRPVEEQTLSRCLRTRAQPLHPRSGTVDLLKLDDSYLSRGGTPGWIELGLEFLLLPLPRLITRPAGLCDTFWRVCPATTPAAPRGRPLPPKANALRMASVGLSTEKKWETNRPAPHRGSDKARLPRCCAAKHG